MATWIIVGGILLLALTLGGALLLVLMFTRGDTDDVHLPRFKRFTARATEDAPGLPDDG